MLMSPNEEPSPNYTSETANVVRYVHKSYLRPGCLGRDVARQVSESGFRAYGRAVVGRSRGWLPVSVGSRPRPPKEESDLEVSSGVPIASPNCHMANQTRTWLQIRSTARGVVDTAMDLPGGPIQN
jgi:hypothetical protein